jgi:DNA-binding CsgD family transcriptional regulator
VAGVAEGMDGEEMQTAWAAGQALSVEEAVAYAVRGRGPRARHPNSLTRAERDVVAWAVKGLTTEEIAERLFISPRTVHSHLRRVYGKLGVTSRRELRQRVAEVAAPD